MLVSVVIPAYNCRKSLENTVKSILCSGMNDFEIIIVDDGSNDGTIEVSDDLSLQYTNVRTIHQKNAGVSTARNCGLENAQGKYILFFDADDTVDEKSLKNVVEIIKDTTPDMLIFGLSFDYYFKGKMYRRDDLKYGKEVLFSKEQWMAEFVELYKCNALSPVWNKFIRKDIIIDNNIKFNKNLIEMEDFLFVIQCMEQCNNVYMLPDVIYRYRQSENEDSTFKRVEKIPSLSKYMQPFEIAIEQLIKSVHVSNKKLQEMFNIVDDIYTSLFFENLRFGNVDEIERVAKDMLSGKYADVIRTSNYETFLLLKEKKYYRVWLQQLKIRFRHWIAIRIKYIKCCWRV